MGLDSVVGIATCYRLDSPEIKSRWGPNIPQPSKPAHPASYTQGTGSFPVVKWPGRSIEHPPTSSTDVKESVELYLYSPSWPLWPVLG
jgi:hypothetical protein